MYSHVPLIRSYTFLEGLITGSDKARVTSLPAYAPIINNVMMGEALNEVRSWHLNVTL